MLTYMDETEIKISHIENIKLIHFYTLDEITDNILGLAIFYNKRETLNLSSMDIHFEMLVAKTIEVYSSLSDEEKLLVFADDTTRKILEDSSSQLTVEKTNGYFEKVQKNGTTECAFVSSNAFIDCFLSPLVSFVFESIFSVMTIDYERLPQQKGWFGKGLFRYLVKGEETVMPYLFIKLSPAHYLAKINNFLEETNCLTLEISYDADNLSVSFSDVSKQTDGMFSYALTPDFSHIIEKKTVKQYGKEIFYSYEAILPEEAKELCTSFTESGITALLPNNLENAVKFPMPWNQYVIADIITPVKEDSEYTENQISYCSLDKDQSAILNFYENRSGLDVNPEKKISSSKMLFQVFKDNNKASVFLSFDNPGCNSSGKYKELLQNKLYLFK